MRNLLVFLLVQILTNALRQTSCVTPMQTASIPRALFIAFVQLVLLETASTARVRTTKNHSIREVFPCMDTLYMYCICLQVAYWAIPTQATPICGSTSPLESFFFLPAPTLCQFQRPSWRKNIRIVVCTHPGWSWGGGYLG